MMIIAAFAAIRRWGFIFSTAEVAATAATTATVTACRDAANQEHCLKINKNVEFEVIKLFTLSLDSPCMPAK
jgi:hypothetical protein